MSPRIKLKQPATITGRRCPQCKEISPLNCKFCRGCGRLLAKKCPSCGAMVSAFRNGREVASCPFCKTKGRLPKICPYCMKLSRAGFVKKHEKCKHCGHELRLRASKECPKCGRIAHDFEVICMNVECLHEFKKIQRKP